MIRISGLCSFSLFARSGPDMPGIITSLSSRSMVPENSASIRIAFFALLAGSTVKCASSSISLDELEKESDGLPRRE